MLDHFSLPAPHPDRVICAAILVQGPAGAEGY